MSTRPPARHPLSRRRQAPRPRGLYTRQRRRGWLARLLTAINRWLHPTPVGRWLHRRLHGGLEVSRVVVRLWRGGPELSGLRIAFVSDLHAGHYMDEAELERLFERVAAEEPDLVCLGGDLVDSHRDEILHFRAPLSRLRPPLGVFAVPGNHEYAAEADLKQFHDVLGEAGVRVLVNEGTRIRHGDDASLWLAGVDDHSHGRPDLGVALHGAREDEPVVLLSHHPDFFYEAASVGVDLTLAGHTHGGQIVFAGRTPLRHSVLGYWRGHFEDDGAQLYVSRGAGVTLLPLRIGAPGEITIVRLMTSDDRRG